MNWQTESMNSVRFQLPPFSGDKVFFIKGILI
jgi:hypothetical protein